MTPLGASTKRVQLPLPHSHHWVHEMPAAENMLNYVEPFYDLCYRKKKA
jgi:hypothetical protein